MTAVDVLEHPRGTDLLLDGVAAGYGSGDVVSEVRVRVPAGSWLAIIGPNGAGKSTLLKATAGLVPHRGGVVVDGTPLSEMSHRERARTIGYAPQNPAMPNGLTVLDYVLLGRTPHLRPLARESASDLDIVSDVLRRLDLADFADRAIQTLSGGERQRAVLARVLVARTELLLLDEPTTGLDIGHAQATLERLDRLRIDDGITVVTTLHDLTLAAQYADELLLLAGGRVVAAGPPDEVLTADTLATHYAASAEVLGNSGGGIVVAPTRP